MRFSLVQDSRIGTRQINQDRVGHWQTAEALLMVVADGLGGHAGGEIAAQIALDIAGAMFTREARPRVGDPAAFLGRVVAGGHVAILREAARRGLGETPRTVLVACVVQGGHAHWLHVGDCRLYLMRAGQVIARTRDHSYVQQLIDDGRIREEAAASHPQRNLIMQCLGGDTRPNPGAAAAARLARDDVLLLCSDGFWGPLTHRHLVTTFLSRPLEQAVEELTVLAERRAGPRCDNVSLVAMAWGEEELAAAEPATVPSPETTVVQDFTATDPDFLRMSDQDIERAIADLRAALKKIPPAQ
jgi:serine/threonine protein phosphatase PrpC